MSQQVFNSEPQFEEAVIKKLQQYGWEENAEATAISSAVSPEEGITTSEPLLFTADEVI